jgi:hypothetical protein
VAVDAAIAGSRRQFNVVRHLFSETRIARKPDSPDGDPALFYFLQQEF